MESILQLVENPIDVFEETSHLLLKIADNILKDPHNPKVRVLQKSNGTIAKKVLNVLGGKECLKAMGFQENGQSFNLPQNDSLNNLRRFRFEINRLKNGEGSNSNKNIVVNQQAAVNEIKTIKTEPTKNVQQNGHQNVNKVALTESFKRIVLPPLIHSFEHPFLRTIEGLFHRVMIYENDYLQQRALSVIPLNNLQMKAQEALRSLQEKVKKEKQPEPEVDLQDFLILELLEWFKHDFFSWVDKPECQICSGPTTFSHMSIDKANIYLTNRVEMFKCSDCNELTAFPRYDDCNILLETRKGRCGEWANVFTLMCRALKWDARYVSDETDHVWTEVYSPSQKKWLHCDPCENVCDKPLLYEVGWGKKLTYVIAYSREEVQDVTWRYSCQHKAVLARRKNCTEDELLNAMATMRTKRQENMSQSRRDYLTKRMLAELTEFMIEKKATADEQSGRVSGGLDWRLSRGEIKNSSNLKSFTWTFSGDVLTQGQASVQYSSALDEYQKIDANGSKEVISSWTDGVFQSESVFRKVEQDWKQSYLCRTEGSSIGKIVWKFQITDNKYTFDDIDYKLEYKTFENGCVEIKMCSNDTCSLITSAKGKLDAFQGCQEITLCAILSGGKGKTGWQHAQLFREELMSKRFTFKLTFRFKERT